MIMMIKMPAPRVENVKAIAAVRIQLLQTNTDRAIIKIEVQLHTQPQVIHIHTILLWHWTRSSSMVIWQRM